MARFKQHIDCSTGEVNLIALTPEEEASRDSEEAAWTARPIEQAPRDLAAELDALKAEVESLKAR